MTPKQWHWLNLDHDKIVDKFGTQFDFSKEWDDTGLPIITVYKTDKYDSFTMAHIFYWDTKLSQEDIEDFRACWKAWRNVNTKSKTSYEKSIIRNK